MDADVMWKHVDAARSSVADMLSGLSEEQWSAPSLCEGWTVRDVAVHLTQAHVSFGRVLLMAVKSGFRFDAMIHRAAVDATITHEEVIAVLRAMIGSRRKAPGAFPLLDVTVHAQDIAIPLGIELPMPLEAAVDSAHRLWAMRFPMNPKRVFRGVAVHATDCDFAVGQGRRVDGSIRDIVLAFAGRPVGLSGLTGAVDAIRRGA